MSSGMRSFALCSALERDSWRDADAGAWRSTESSVKGKAFDFVHAVGALLIDFDIPGNQIGLVAMRRDAQGVDETLTRPCVVHRTVR